MRGIYAIRNKVNGKQCIGSTVSLERRRRRHFRTLRRGTHHNCYLQRAFTLYGENAFEFIVLESMKDPKMLIQREQFYFNTLCPEYNVCSTAGSTLGRSTTEETRRKLSAAALGNQNALGHHYLCTEETRWKLSQAAMGHHLSTETREKLSKAMTGNQHALGHRPSEETRQKLSEALKGEKNPMYGKHPCKETRQKMSEAQKGEKNGFYGKHHSEETRKKLRAAAKRQWAKKRAQMEV